MKKILLICALLFNLVSLAQEDKTVTLTVSGSGKTLEESKTNALRSAIEQAFGTFISSKTEILNDNLVKDEIVSVSNGNIQKFEIISELQIPDGGYATSIKATVSINKLTSFVESKGVVVEFKGGLFASNVLMQELYEKNEITAIKNFGLTITDIAKKSFDYKILAEEPFMDNTKWVIPITIDVLANKNFLNIPTLLEKTLNSLSLSDAEVENYKTLNKKVYPITLATLKSSRLYYLRNNESRMQIQNLIYNFKNAISNFTVFNGITKKTLNDYNVKSTKPSIYSGHINSNIKIDDTNFGVIAEQFNGNIQGKSLFKTNDYNLPAVIHNDVIKEIDDIYCDNHNTGPGIGSKYYNFSNNFKPLKKIMYSSYNSTNYGLVISFAEITENKIVVQFRFDDLKTLNEIKQISKYEIIKN